MLTLYQSIPNNWCYKKSKHTQSPSNLYTRDSLPQFSSSSQLPGLQEILLLRLARRNVLEKAPEVGVLVAPRVRSVDELGRRLHHALIRKAVQGSHWDSRSRRVHEDSVKKALVPPIAENLSGNGGFIYIFAHELPFLKRKGWNCMDKIYWRIVLIE